jgi:hypothetical protein
MDLLKVMLPAIAMLVGVIVLAIIAAPADAEMYGEWGLDMTERGSIT